MTSEWAVESAVLRRGAIVLTADKSVEKEKGFYWTACYAPRENDAEGELADGYAPTIEAAQAAAEAWLSGFVESIRSAS